MRPHTAALLLAICCLAAAATASDLLDVAAVPDAATPATTQLRQLQQAAGGYGGYGRSLLQSSPGGYGYGSGRRLAEEAAPLEPRDPVLEYVEQRDAAHDAQLMREQAAAGGVSAAAVAALKHAAQARTRSAAARASSSSSGVVLPAGMCYCRYDQDFNTWALAEEACKEALYSRCQTEDELQCRWLDRYYAPAAGPGHSLPHEADIAAFVFEDCSPQPPCACADLAFDGSDAVAATVACCRDLRVACKTPYSGLACKKVEAFCSDDAAMPLLAAWTRHVLHHSDCRAYNGLPYQYASLATMQAASSASTPQLLKHAAATVAQHQPSEEAALLKQALLDMQAQLPLSEGGAAAAAASSRRALTALAAVAAGAVCVAVAAVAFAMRREEALAPITSAAAAPSAADVYAALNARSTKSSSKKARDTLPLRRGASGDACLSSAAISIGALDAMQQPLLHQEGGLSRSESNGSLTGDNMP